MKRKRTRRRYDEHDPGPEPDTLAVLARLLNTSEVRLDQEHAREYFNDANSLAVLAELLDTSEVQLCEHQELAVELLERAYAILENTRKWPEPTSNRSDRAPHGRTSNPPVRRRSRRSRR